MNDKAILKAGKCIVNAEKNALAAAQMRMGQSFVKAVKIILECKGKVIVTGVGKSGIIARKIASTMASTGTQALFVHPVECMHGDFGILSPGDIVIALSKSGQTQEIIKLLPLIKEYNLKLISITGNKKSALAKASDAVLDCAVKKEACPLNVAPTASTTVSLALGDAVAMAVMELKGFKKEDFARLHPGGSLGALLNLKVADIMHEGKNNPVVKKGTTVKKALIVMTNTRLGAVSVVDANNKVTGFFTDGDLRRLLQKGHNLEGEIIDNVMTKNPVTVAAGTLAVEAAKLMRQKKIDNIPVVKNGKIAGILDERDLLEVFPLL